MDTTKKKSVLKEINALMKLNHPNIVKLYDVIETPKQIYLVTEFVPGKMLSSYLRERLQSERQEDESANTHQI